MSGGGVVLSPKSPEAGDDVFSLVPCF